MTHKESTPQQTTITDDSVYWVMDWNQSLHPTKPPQERIFETEKALARLLAEDVIFINDHWWEKDWPPQAQKLMSLNVNCNDIFAWACAEAEELMAVDIQSLYDMWHKDRVWGAAKWCAIRRNMKPQPPVVDAMKKSGSWDETMESLNANPCE